MKRNVEILTCDFCKEITQAMSKCVLCKKDVCDKVEHRVLITLCLFEGAYDPVQMPNKNPRTKAEFSICRKCYGEHSKKEIFLKECIDSLSQSFHGDISFLKFEEEYF